MKYNIILGFFTLLLQLSMISCNRCQDTKQIVGLYRAGVDGFMVPGLKIIDNGINNLEMKSDKTFILFDGASDDKTAIHGTWEIRSCKISGSKYHKLKESILVFKVKGKTTTAICYGGAKIIFSHPQEFYGDESKILKYLKLSAKI